jgi:hypothetical protein
MQVTQVQRWDFVNAIIGDRFLQNRISWSLDQSLVPRRYEVGNDNEWWIVET